MLLSSLTAQLDFTQFYFNLISKFPDTLWYVPVIVFAVLIGTAIWDACTGRVPTWPLLLTLVCAFAGLVTVSGFSAALTHSYPVLLPVVILCLLNALCVKMTGHDAFGMGDVKWTVLATFAFGLWPVFWAWVLGSWLALAWLGVCRLARRFLTCLGSSTYQGHVYVHFVPFLLLGLCFSLLFSLQSL